MAMRCGCARDRLAHRRPRRAGAKRDQEGSTAAAHDHPAPEQAAAAHRQHAAHRPAADHRQGAARAPPDPEAHARRRMGRSPVSRARSANTPPSSGSAELRFNDCAAPRRLRWRAGVSARPRHPCIGWNRSRPPRCSVSTRRLTPPRHGGGAPGRGEGDGTATLSPFARREEFRLRSASAPPAW